MIQRHPRDAPDLRKAQPQGAAPALPDIFPQGLIFLHGVFPFPGRVLFHGSRNGAQAQGSPPQNRKPPDKAFAVRAMEEHLQKQGVADLQASDIIMFRSDATISDVLGETQHFWQNRRGMNDDKPIDICTALNEIDTKEYLINVAKKYKTPVEATEPTKHQLEHYKNMLKELEGKNESHRKQCLLWIHHTEI